MAKNTNNSRATNLQLIDKVLKQEVGLDIETLGISRGSSIVELSIFDPNTNTVNQFRVAPNLTVTEASIKMQDVSNLRTSVLDVLVEHPALRRARELELEAKVKGKPAPKAVSKLDTLVFQTLMDDSIQGQGLFASEIKKSFKKGTAPDLSVKGIEEMSKKDFKKVLSAVQDISHKALTTKNGDNFFKKAVGEGSPFIQRAYADTQVGVMVREQFVAGRTRRAAPGFDRGSIGQLRQELATYSGNKSLILKVHDVTTDQLIDEVGKLIKNKSVQIASSQFESKQIGALIAVAEQDVQRQLVAGEITKGEAAAQKKKISGFRSIIAETPVGTTDILPISGAKVNQARAQAQITGDYAGLFRPMLEEMASGKKARVTDILDLVRSQTSFEKELGIKQVGASNILSVDVAQRLYGFSEGVAGSLTKKELHVGAYDVLSQSAVTRSALMQTEALSEVRDLTDRGKELIKQAEKKQGSLYKAIVLAQIKKEATPFIEQANVATRLARAAENLKKLGASPETSGTFKMGPSRERLTADGNIIKVASAKPGERLELGSLDEVYKHIKKQSAYANADLAKGVQLFMDSVNEGQKTPLISFDQKTEKFSFSQGYDNLTAGDFKRAETMKRDYLDKQFQLLDERIKSKDISGLSPESMNSYIKGLKKSYLQKDSFIARHMNWKHIDFKAGKTAGVMAAAMGTVGMLGMVGDMLGGQKQQRGGAETLRTMNYERWFAANSQFHGLEQYDERGNSGFSERGMGAVQRKQKTDFGSPYQGPQYSQYVQEQQDLLRERRMYEMQKFAHVHFSNEGAIGNLLNTAMANKDPEYTIRSFINSVNLSSRMMASGHKFASQGQFVSGSDYAGMADRQLFKVDLSKYKVSASDADTIVLKKKSTDSNVAGFFGMDNQDSISIRLAGIDAPETQHGEKKGMPLANRALGRLNAIMNSGQQMELLIDPTNITYGRQVGSLFVNGRNVQLDLLKSGDVKFLDFQGGGVTPQYDRVVYSRQSKLAEKNESGIYSEPYFKPLIEFEKRSKQSITFNTMVNIDKVSENSKLMSIYSIMHAADRQGFYSPTMAMEAARIGEATTTIAGEYKNPIMFGKSNSPHKAYIDNLAYDNSVLMKKRESAKFDRLSRKNGYDKLDKKLSLDTTGTSTSVYNKRRYNAFDRFNTEREMKYKRQQAMQMMQKSGLRQLNQSPIGHHRM